MRKSSRLRLNDIQAAMELKGECRDLWADPAAWRQHLMRGACRLAGQTVGAYMELGCPETASPHSPMRVLAADSFGWRDDAARAHYLRGKDWFDSVFQVMPGSQRLLDLSRQSGRAAALRLQLCPDAEWYGSWVFNEFHRPAFNDGYAVSVVRDLDREVMTVLSVHQDPSDAPPTVRTCRVLAYLHRQIAPLIGSTLAVAGQRSVDGLTPRIRQALDRVLAGDGEKQIAAALRIAPSTAHQYVGRLYQHFGVDSRAELMAYFLRRRPGSA